MDLLYGYLSDLPLKWWEEEQPKKKRQKLKNMSRKKVNNKSKPKEKGDAEKAS